MPYYDAQYQPDPYQYVHSGETYASITKNRPMQILSYLVILPHTQAGSGQGFYTIAVNTAYSLRVAEVAKRVVNSILASIRLDCCPWV